MVLTLRPGRCGRLDRTDILKTKTIGGKLQRGVGMPVQ
jgi:hypothetical protein